MSLSNGLHQRIKPHCAYYTSLPVRGTLVNDVGIIFFQLR